MTEPIFVNAVMDTRDGILHASAETATAAGVPLEAQACIAGHVDAIRTLVRAATASRAIEALRRPTPDPLEGTYESRYALGWNDALHRVPELL